jgi:hypothetical protein
VQILPQATLVIGQLTCVRGLPTKLYFIIPVVGAVIDEEDGSGEGVTEEASGTGDDNVKGKTQLL